MKKIFLVFSLIMFVFCTQNENQKTERKNSKEEPKIENTFKNHLYIIGPHLDDFGNLEMGCDCCLSEAYFVNEDEFIFGCYCLEGDDYGLGKYKVTQKGIELYFYDEMLSLEYDLSDEYDSVNPQKTSINYKITQIKKHKTIWTKYKNSRFYKTSDNEFAEDSDSLKIRFLDRIKNDEQKLNFIRRNNIKI